MNTSGRSLTPPPGPVLPERLDQGPLGISRPDTPVLSFPVRQPTCQPCLRPSTHVHSPSTSSHRRQSPVSRPLHPGLEHPGPYGSVLLIRPLGLVTPQGVSGRDANRPWSECRRGKENKIEKEVLCINTQRGPCRSLCRRLPQYPVPRPTTQEGIGVLRELPWEVL